MATMSGGLKTTALTTLPVTQKHIHRACGPVTASTPNSPIPRQLPHSWGTPCTGMARRMWEARGSGQSKVLQVTCAGQEGRGVRDPGEGVLLQPLKRGTWPQHCPAQAATHIISYTSQ